MNGRELGATWVTPEAYEDASGYEPVEWSSYMPQWYVDNQPPPNSKRFFFTTQRFYNANDPLISSGLLGPVKIHVVKKRRLLNAFIA